MVYTILYYILYIILYAHLYASFTALALATIKHECIWFSASGEQPWQISYVCFCVTYSSLHACITLSYVFAPPTDPPPENKTTTHKDPHNHKYLPYNTSIHTTTRSHTPNCPHYRRTPHHFRTFRRVLCKLNPVSIDVLPWLLTLRSREWVHVLQLSSLSIFLENMYCCIHL